MPLIIGSIQLNQESIRIPELKRFLRPAGFQLQIARLYFIDCFVGVESGDSEVIVIEAGGGSLLLNSKETLANAEDVCLIRMLLKRHPKELLVELRGTANVRNPHGDVIKGYGAQVFLLRGGLLLGYVEVLNRRQIEVHLFRSDQVIARAVAEQRDDRVGKGCRIEPAVRVWIGIDRIHARNAIETDAHRESRAR